MENLINLTPHPICLADPEGNIIRTIEPCGTIARVSTHSVETGQTVAGLPVVVNTVGAVTDLPAPHTHHGPCGEMTPNIYIVSLFVLNALTEDRSDVVAPDTGPTCVRDDKGRILAVRQFIGRA